MCWFMLLVLDIATFFFNDTATTEIYTLSLHDALPICFPSRTGIARVRALGEARLEYRTAPVDAMTGGGDVAGDRKSTRLNSSHANNSYAVFCLKKKNSRTAADF